MDATVQIYDQWFLTAQRQNDKSLMLAFKYKFGKLKKKLAQINRCRMWLNITTLLDVTDAYEKRLCPYASKGEKLPHLQTKMQLDKLELNKKQILENMDQSSQKNFHYRRSKPAYPPQKLATKWGRILDLIYI